MIRLSRPYFGEQEPLALARVLASGVLVQGSEVLAFESAVSRFLDAFTPPALSGCVQAVCVSTGTTALELALATSPNGSRRGVGAGDEVIVPAVTWPSPGHAAILRGATPVLVDVTPDTWCIDPLAARDALSSRTRAVIAIDQFGVPAGFDALSALGAQQYLIEDSACALGSSLKGVPCGLLGEVGIFSFHPRKVITTAEGGMLVTRRPELAYVLRALRNHGQSSPGVFECAGPNARMSELHAAVGTAQMAKLVDIIERRHALASRLREALRLGWQRAPAGARVNHQTLGFVLPEPARGSRREARDALISALRGDDIEASMLSYALHRLPQFAAFEVNRGRSFAVADAVVDGGVALPLHPAMTRDDCEAIIASVTRHAGWALGREALR